MSKDKNDYRSGFVAIIGKPNAGKSTLMNLLINEQLAITHSKAQTTRHKLHGIVSDAHAQIIYIDTPGLIAPAYPLQTAMMEAVEVARADADLIIWLVDVKDLEQALYENHTKKPTLLVLNKVDLITANQLNATMAYWKHHYPKLTIIPISAIKNENIDRLIRHIVACLPKHPPYYPEATLTDKPERFFVQEIIREKILDQYHQEIPYSVEVAIEDFKEMESLIKIRSIIHVERPTQKGIIIGQRGAALKKLGIAARQALENFFQKKIFLEQHVKVTPNWRKSGLLLTRFGYPTIPKKKDLR
ncbi:MAG: GTPase Era [Candidatus Cardinium sp.]|uniref:GTPase Era n=1 Tax=Cardinium endosymbiont of Dermatophagoides farinae TaxID=2597823 RepID=UPI0011834FBB|nr:GTPase Era [Cardinium endosymbiont of Dermatophagoides farinae]TSJ80528.1 GTPase Era [Cardinium endosymbiont of Dermatophagoides farinae]UWW96500.1 MAG: GTPase Era [Candidatus Cardinium sp.]